MVGLQGAESSENESTKNRTHELGRKEALKYGGSGNEIPGEKDARDSRDTRSG